MAIQPYSPVAVFGNDAENPPRVMVAPQRYVQGPGVIHRVGHYMHSLMKVRRAAVLASKRGHASQGAQLIDSLKSSHIESVNAEFHGECSLQEIEAQVKALEQDKPDCVVAVGGGKLVDAGKSIAYRLGVPVVIVPTLASNDAPCSALSVLYTPEGISDDVEYFPQNPALVVVDTEVVANASERYLVAGMGDAMATWYEAKVCLENPQARNMLGARPTLASCAMGETCAHALYQHGEAASSAVIDRRTNDALEQVVEANTLLSGIGFESGGLAVAHAMALALTEIDVVHHNYLHGEMVAMGLMAQLSLDKGNEARKVGEFLARVGLPVNLDQISLSLQRADDIDTIVEATLANPLAHNMSEPLRRESLRQAVSSAHKLGQQITAEMGDQAYRRVHA